MEDQPKKRGRPRKYPEGYDRRKAWKESHAEQIEQYEQSPERKQAKAQWIRLKRQNTEETQSEN